ncbi:MAG: DUF6020 family protein [Sporolactobacillus sp.]
MALSKIKKIIKNNQLLVSMVISIFSTQSLSAALKLGPGSLFLSNSVISAFLFIIFSFIIFKSMKVIKKRSLVYALLISLLFSTCLIYGTQIFLADRVQITSIGILIHIIGLSLIFTAIFILFFENLSNIESKLVRNRFTKYNLIFEANPKFFLSVWIIIIIAWLPYFLSLFPGVLFIDSGYQLAQITNGFHLNTSHPILHTLYVYGTLSLGKSMFGSYEIGMAFYSISQLLMLSATYSYLCYFLAKYRVPVIYQVITITYFALVPIHAIFAVTSTKDVMFSAAMLLLVLSTLEMTINTEHFFSSLKSQIFFVITALFMFALRNNGIYPFLLCLPIFILVFRKHWIKMTMLCLITLLLYGVYTGPIYNLLHVEQGDMREALSIPIQQIARAMRDDPKKITSSEKQTIYEIIPKEGLEQYNSRTSDPVKATFRTDILKKDPLKYVRTWVNIGIKCPQAYINGFLSTNFGFWYPDMIYPDPVTNHQYMQNWMAYIPESHVYVPQHSLFPAFHPFINYFIYKTSFQKVPVISMLFNEGFAFWILAFTAALCFYIRKPILLVPFVLYFGLWITLLLSPVVLLRYAYPIMIAEPLMIAIILFNDRFSEKTVSIK